MDTQQPKEMHCIECGSVMKLDQFGRYVCLTCQKNTQPKELYEEAFFPLQDYTK